MVKCNNCGYEMDEQLDIASENELLCPSCGSKSKFFRLNVGGAIIALSGRLVGEKESTDGTQAIRVEDSQKRSSATDSNGNKITYRIK